MKFKAGVKLTGLQPQTLLAMQIVDRVFQEEMLREPTCTSANDGKHMTNSKHYKGFAFDLRTKDIQTSAKLAVFNSLYERLHHIGFDVIQESLGLDGEHLHLEYDPK